MDNGTYASLRSRFFAGMIDGLVLLPLSFLWPEAHLPRIPATLLVIWYLLMQSSGCLYSIIMHKRFGQTLGKMAMKIRVVSYPDGSSLSYPRAMVRDVGLIVPAMLASLYDMQYLFAGQNPYERPDGMNAVDLILLYSSLAWFVLEIGSALLSSQRRALHDHIAGTVVVVVPGQALQPTDHACVSALGVGKSGRGGTFRSGPGRASCSGA